MEDEFFWLSISSSKSLGSYYTVYSRWEHLKNWFGNRHFRWTFETSMRMLTGAAIRILYTFHCKWTCFREANSDGRWVFLVIHLHLRTFGKLLHSLQPVSSSKKLVWKSTFLMNFWNLYANAYWSSNWILYTFCKRFCSFLYLDDRKRVVSHRRGVVMIPPGLLKPRLMRDHSAPCFYSNKKWLVSSQMPKSRISKFWTFKFWYVFWRPLASIDMFSGGEFGWKMSFFEDPFHPPSLWEVTLQVTAGENI